MVEIFLPNENNAVFFEFHKGEAKIIPTGSADFSLHFGEKALDFIFAENCQDVGDFGVAFFKCLTKKGQPEHISAKVKTGIFNLTKKGYLGLIPSGGPKVLKFLSSKGVLGPKGVKKAIDYLRG